MIFKAKHVYREEDWGFGGGGYIAPPKVTVVNTANTNTVNVSPHTVITSLPAIEVITVSLQEQLKDLKEKEKIQGKISSSFSSML